MAGYLRVFRSVQRNVAQVLTTTGTQQSLEFCARLLADHGDTVWAEYPALNKARTCARSRPIA